MEKVSAIVAIYKSEKFLRKLIESIIEQTWDNLEIILVDDGSPDNSGKICDEYAKIDDRIIAIHKNNGGACEARNTGLEIATGDYVVIIDGDDWLELDFIEYLMKLIHLNNSEMALTDKIFTTRDRLQTQDDRLEVWSSEDAATAILYPKMEVGPWNKIYKRSLLRDNNITFSRPWSGEGLHFASTAAQYANHVGVGHRKIYNYRLNNANSGLTNYNVQMGINALENIYYIKDHLRIKTKKIINAVDYHIWRNYCFLFNLIIATDSKEKYLKEYKECKKKIRLLLPSALLRAEIDIRSKLYMIANAMFPVYVSKKGIRKKKIELERDDME